MTEARSNLIVACDMGATSTKVLLGDLKGQAHRELSGQGFNLRQGEPYDVGVILAELVRSLYLGAKFRPDDPAGIGVGIAGAGDLDARAEVKQVLKKRWPQSRIMVHHDAFIAHYGAFEGGPGVLLIAGTGSIAYGRNAEGREARAGGWGWMLGDEGSGWWIGREAVRAVLLAHETGAQTHLTQLVLDAFRVETPYDLFPRVYSQYFERSKVSNLAEKVVEIAEQGDDAARDVLRRAGSELGKAAVRVATQLQLSADEFKVALLGSVGEQGGFYLREGLRTVLAEYEIPPPAVSSGALVKEGQVVQPEGAPLHGEVGPEREEGSVDDNEFVPGLPAPKQYTQPPKDLTLERKKGPRLVKPYENAIEGAASWVRNTLLKEKFA